MKNFDKNQLNKSFEEENLYIFMRTAGNASIMRSFPLNAKLNEVRKYF